MISLQNVLNFTIYLFQYVKHMQFKLQIYILLSLYKIFLANTQPILEKYFLE